MGFNSGLKGSTDNVVELALNVSEVTRCEVLHSCCSVAEDSGVFGMLCHNGW
jgi:hypothetical protein